MIRALLATIVILAAPAQADAQDIDRAAIVEQIAAETRVVDLPGPVPGELRRIHVWRPPNAGAERLPVLYLADGRFGLAMALTHLHAAVADGRVRPFMIVAMDSHDQDRRREYALGRIEAPYWHRHFAWVVDVVIPWAEANAGAAQDAQQRGVGGYSNGADFAIVAALRRPDLFTRVLAHSPVNDPRTPIVRTPGSRWVLTVGRGEDEETRTLHRRITSALSDGALRQCAGRWGHDMRAWTDLSPGAIAWLFDLAPPETVETRLESGPCRTS